MWDFGAPLLKTDVLVHNFWTVYARTQNGCHFWNLQFPFIWDPTLLYLDIILFSLYTVKRVNFDPRHKQKK